MLNENEFKEITNYFYRSPSAKNVLAALTYFLNHDSLVDTIEHGHWGSVPYFFYRAAQVYPQIWTEYEALFTKASHEERLFLLLVYSLEKDNQIDQCLLSWRGNKEFSKEYSEIDEALSADARGRNILEIERVKSPSVLDLLWAEFIVTGNQAAVEKIIDVLEWNDLVRNRLIKSLENIDNSTHGPQRAKNDIGALLFNQGIIINEENRSIYSSQDLDCFCALEGCERTSDRMNLMLSIFPFELADEDINHVLIKASAKWSLCANAQQHELVLRTCIKESKKRTGRCRLSLLEIISRVYMALDKLEQSLIYLIESLTFDPIERGKQTQNAELAFNELYGLIIKPAELAADAVLDSESIINNCIASCGGLRTYRSKMIWKEDSISDVSSEVYWELEFEKPDKFRVSQTTGHDFDEWITIGDFHFRGPMYGQSRIGEPNAFEGDISFNHALLVDSYLDLLRTTRPDSIDGFTSEVGGFFIITFSRIEASELPLFRDHEVDIEILIIRLWIEKNTNYLAKVEIMVAMGNDNESTENLNITHLFTGHNDEISIIPPPFKILNYEESESGLLENIDSLEKKRLKTKRIGAAVGTITGISIASFITISDFILTPLVPQILAIATTGVIFGAIGYFLSGIIIWLTPAQRPFVRAELESVNRKSSSSWSIGATLIFLFLLMGVLRQCGVID